MSKVWLSVVAATGLAAVCAAPYGAQAADTSITTKKLVVKDNANAAKRQLQVSSTDGTDPAAVHYADAGDPGTNGASVHAYSTTDDICVVLHPGANWKDTGSKWKYNDKVAKRSLQIGDGKLLVKIKSGVAFTLADDAPQDAVNVIVQTGTTTRYCMRCSAPSKDTVKIFTQAACADAPCDAEPSVCDPTVTTTTTTTTTLTPPAQVLLGALNATTGRFNYNATLGLTGSDAACSSNFPGSHTCTYAELQAAETSGDLLGLKSTPGNQTVTSFWAINSLEPDNLQCHTTIPWDYATAHTGHFGEKVSLDNGTGALGTLQVGQPDGAFCSGSSWVGCCH
ncbi:MAG: hypothetical protein HY899_06535 [Deltaproteobacteria bacterium]|nr:hypothetical protein [Deltaproteobacteria bacterium]